MEHHPHQNIVRLRELSNELTAPPDDLARTISELLADGVMFANREGRIVYTSPLLDETFGYDQGELIGEPVEILVPAGLRENHRKLREKFEKEETRARRMMHGRILEGVRKTGERIQLQIGLAKVEAGAKHASLIIVVFKQVTGAPNASLATTSSTLSG